MEEAKKKTVFRLGITLAGAVSAGAYSAGVMYYLLNNLRAWQQAKDNNTRLLKKHNDDLAAAITDGFDESIPDHDVIIEVLGGSSAGSVVAAIAALAICYEKNQNINLDDINDFVLRRKDCMLYQAWVELMDNGKSPETMLKLLNTNGPDDKSGPFGLLNDQVLKDLQNYHLDRIFPKNGSPGPGYSIPKYISAQLQIIFTMTSLHGVPVGIYFSNDANFSNNTGTRPAHLMYVHKSVAHFQLEPKHNKLAMDLDLRSREQTEGLFSFSLASGAFPIGLPPHEMKFETAYIESIIRDEFGPDIKNLKVLMPNPVEPEFPFGAVDGGALNNEPFTEVQHAMESNMSFNNMNNLSYRQEQKVYIMIDPFPNFDSIGPNNGVSDKKAKPIEESVSYNYPKTPRQILVTILNAIRGQAMTKNPAALSAFSNNSGIGMIFPSRSYGNPKFPLATGGLGGFGGFLSKEFREHDFILGMKNCQSFIRNYFYIPDSEHSKYISYSSADWSINGNKYKRFHKDFHENEFREIRRPIIPDMALPMDGDHDKNLVTPPSWPTITPKDVLRFLSPLRRRIWYLFSKYLFVTFLHERTSKTNTKTILSNFIAQPHPEELSKLDSKDLLRSFKTRDMIRMILCSLTILCLFLLFALSLPVRTFWLIAAMGAILVVLLVRFMIPLFLSSYMLKIVLKELNDRAQISPNRPAKTPKS